MRVRKVLRGLAASSVAAVVSVGAAAAPAYADTHHWMYTEDDNPGGRVDFWTYGDVVQLCDIQADGKSVGLEVWDVTQGFRKYAISASGDGRCTDRQASDGSPYDLKEGNWFRFRICLMDNWIYADSTCDDADWYNG